MPAEVRIPCFFVPFFVTLAVATRALADALVELLVEYRKGRSIHSMQQMDCTDEDASRHYPQGVIDLIFSDSYLREKIKDTPRHEYTQVVSRERLAAASAAELPTDGAPPPRPDDLERIITNGRWCPFESKFHLSPSPPTAYFIVDKKAMCMRPRCSATDCSALEAGNGGEVPPVISLAPNDEDVEYARRKGNFERTHFKVICPKPFYVRENDDTGLPSHTTLDYLTAAQMLETYGAMLPPIIVCKKSRRKEDGVDGPGDEKRAKKEVSFVGAWMGDENARTFTRVECLPPPLPCPKDAFNVFKGFPAAALPQLYGPNLENGDPPYKAKAWPFLNHIRLMFPDEEVATFVVKWLAWIIQKPATPTQVLLVIQGPQGCGKNWVLERLMKCIIGNSYACMTESPERTLFNLFGECRRNKILVFIDDTNVGEIKMNTEKLMSLVTADTISYEIKCGPTITTVNCANYCIGTNKRHPIKASNEARREFIAHAAATGPLDINNKEENKNYFTDLYKLLDDPTFVRAVYDFLMSVDLIGVYLQKDKPHTSALHDIKGLSADPAYHFLAEKFTTQDDAKGGAHGHNGPALYGDYKEWFDRAGMKIERRLDAIIFYKMLKEIPGAEFKTNKETKNNGNRFQFSYEKLAGFLRQIGVLEEEEPPAPPPQHPVATHE